MKYTCSMETVQQNGRFTLFSSKFLSIYSILYGGGLFKGEAGFSPPPPTPPGIPSRELMNNIVIPIAELANFLIKEFNFWDKDIILYFINLSLIFLNSEKKIKFFAQNWIKYDKMWINRKIYSCIRWHNLLFLF